MPLHDDAVVLADIERAARLILEFRGDSARQGFERDLKTQSAVLHQFLILGEAVKRLSREFRDAHPETPWSLISGMRDKLIHAYELVDIDQIWETMESSVPLLLRQLVEIDR